MRSILKKMYIILLGPPGVGKGTLADGLADKFNFPKISTGDIFRDAVQQGTELGEKAKEFLDKGVLVPDEVVIGIVKERLQKDDCKDGFILDGFPRTINQAKALDKITKIDIVTNLLARDEIIIERVSSRRICVNCQTGYNIISLKPKEKGICDKCGRRLIQRDDDKPETVKKRLETYRKETEPLIEYYEERDLLQNIDAEKIIEEVFKGTIKVLSDSLIKNR